MRNWLKELRMKCKKTQCDTARHLGISQSSYCKIESGERQADLNLSTAIKLSEFLGVSMKQIIAHEENSVKSKPKNRK